MDLVSDGEEREVYRSTAAMPYSEMLHTREVYTG